VRVRLGLMMLGLASAACGASGHGSDQAVRRELRHILSRPEYNRNFNPGAIERFWTSVRDGLFRAANWFMGLFAMGGDKASRLASIVFACLTLLAFLLLLAFVIRRLVRRAMTSDREFGTELDAHGIPSPRPLMKEAERLAASGDFRGAFRCAYLASILYLDESGALRYERSRTNWEYLRQLAEGGHDAAGAELRPLTLDFDRKFYGREVCVQDDYARAAAVFRKLSTEARA
jgi:hypothetical protein